MKLKFSDEEWQILRKWLDRHQIGDQVAFALKAKMMKQDSKREGSADERPAESPNQGN